uniref:E1 ubiquitin-activating enzyme n=1 Tax=Oncorhynchus mykiss TaxID=8022 RepID=A0A8C7VRZ1_ONCMY
LSTIKIGCKNELFGHNLRLGNSLVFWALCGRYVLGHEAMRRMGTANVLIAGMRGLGVEIAKNVILSGVKSVTVQDEGPAEWMDFSSQFFLLASHLGQNRALSSLSQLSGLNPHVHVSAHTGPLKETLLQQFQVVVLTDSTLDDQQRFGTFCHSNGIKFIVADTKGLCGQLFCDFGEEFEVLDTDGETPASAMIDHITKADPGVVTCIEQRHGFVNGSTVSLSEVCGMTKLNSYGPVDIKVLGPDSFSICDTSSFSEYKKGGVATEVKKSKMLQFKPLDEALVDPELLVMTDYGKMTKHQTLHLAFQALHGFVKRVGRLPKPRSQSDAELLVAMVTELNKVSHLDQLDEGVVQSLSFTACGDLAPVNAFIGGLAAQEEAMFYLSGKLSIGMCWWIFIPCLSALSTALLSLLQRGSRYDGQTAVFGSGFQERLGEQKYFLVGAGAIGCELLKNFALIGLGAGEGGHITVTDMDSIERSNLNRQFLFRSQDIGVREKQKSEVAAQAVRVMNPNMNITAHQNRLDPDSEQVYGHAFFMGLDGVAAALDNVEARVYLDGRCVQHQRPMLEGGTLGSKGHTLVVVPHLTESYGPAKTGSQNASPLCTLKNFPHRIEHTLQVRRLHEGPLGERSRSNDAYAIVPCRDAAGFLERTLGRGEAEALEVLECVWGGVGGQRPQGWEDCVGWARRQWETLYNNDIAQLLHCFPSDQLTSSGLPFWSGAKRCPHPLTFDPSNTTHMDYVVAAANLYGQIYGIVGTRDSSAIRSILETVHIPAFTPKSTVKIHLTDKEMEEERESGHLDTGRLDELQKKLSSPPVNSAALQMHPIDFEKDDDNNFHIDYIVAASNLRAENYDIPTADRHKSKLIAGRIIPAIATTTAAVAGLMCVELYKLVQGHRKISSYRSGYINLAVQYCVLSEPLGRPSMHKGTQVKEQRKVCSKKRELSGPHLQFASDVMPGFWVIRFYGTMATL